jgi:hypothetical protein
LPTSSAGTPSANAASAPAMWSEVCTTNSAPNARPQVMVPSVMVSVNRPNGLPDWPASRNSSETSSVCPDTARSSSSHTSRSGSTSYITSPDRAPTSTISAVVATSTSCPATRAAQASGTIGSIRP